MIVFGKSIVSVWRSGSFEPRRGFRIACAAGRRKGREGIWGEYIVRRKRKTPISFSTTTVWFHKYFLNMLCEVVACLIFLVHVYTNRCVSMNTRFIPRRGRRRHVQVTSVSNAQRTLGEQCVFPPPNPCSQVCSYLHFSLHAGTSSFDVNLNPCSL